MIDNVAATAANRDAARQSVAAAITTAGKPRRASEYQLSTTDTHTATEPADTPADAQPFLWSRAGDPGRVERTPRENRERFARSNAHRAAAAATEFAREAAVIRRLREHFTVERIDGGEIPF